MFMRITLIKKSIITSQPLCPGENLSLSLSLSLSLQQDRNPKSNSPQYYRKVRNRLLLHITIIHVINSQSEIHVNHPDGYNLQTVLQLRGKRI